MTNITIKELVPQIGKYKVKHPITDQTEWVLPDGSTGPLEIWLVGRSSKKWLDFMKTTKEANKDVTTTELFSRVTDVARDFLAEMIVGWLDNGAIDTSYSPENARDLVNDPNNIWLLEQLQSFVLTESNFFLMTSET